MAPVPRPVVDRINEKIVRRDGCWIFNGYRKNGYGSIWLNGVDYYAHRAMYQAEVGEIPDGYHLHHRCRTRACVNPAHLLAVSNEDHARVERGRRIVALPFWGEDAIAVEDGLGLS